MANDSKTIKIDNFLFPRPLAFANQRLAAALSGQQGKVGGQYRSALTVAPAAIDENPIDFQEIILSAIQQRLEHHAKAGTEVLYGRDPKALNPDNTDNQLSVDTGINRALTYLTALASPTLPGYQPPGAKARVQALTQAALGLFSVVKKLCCSRYPGGILGDHTGWWGRANRRYQATYKDIPLLVLALLTLKVAGSKVAYTEIQQQMDAIEQSSEGNYSDALLQTYRQLCQAHLAPRAWPTAPVVTPPPSVPPAAPLATAARQALEQKITKRALQAAKIAAPAFTDAQLRTHHGLADIIQQLNAQLAANQTAGLEFANAINTLQHDVQAACQHTQKYNRPKLPAHARVQVQSNACEMTAEDLKQSVATVLRFANELRRKRQTLPAKPHIPPATGVTEQHVNAALVKLMLLEASLRTFAFSLQQAQFLRQCHPDTLADKPLLQQVRRSYRRCTQALDNCFTYDTQPGSVTFCTLDQGIKVLFDTPRNQTWLQYLWECLVGWGQVLLGAVGPYLGVDVADKRYMGTRAERQLFAFESRVEKPYRDHFKRDVVGPPSLLHSYCNKMPGLDPQAELESELRSSPIASSGNSNDRALAGA